MSASPTVLKFGGTSVGDAAAFERAAGIVRSHGGARPVVVVSAMSKVTDGLLAALEAAARDPAAALESLRPLLERHRVVAQRLLAPDAAGTFQDQLDRAHQALANLLQQVKQAPAAARPKLHDEGLSFGEQLAATLLTAVLSARGLPARYVDARRCIVTDEAHGGAAPLQPETDGHTADELAPVLERGMVPVLGGYIAATGKGVTTTLGRGGSDYSAAIVGAALAAS